MPPQLRWIEHQIPKLGSGLIRPLLSSLLENTLYAETMTGIEFEGQFANNCLTLTTTLV